MNWNPFRRKQSAEPIRARMKLIALILNFIPSVYLTAYLFHIWQDSKTWWHEPTAIFALLYALVSGATVAAAAIKLLDSDE